MPWSGSEFSQRHNHSLHGAQATHAAHIANAMLRRGVPEGEAIATANKWGLNHRDEGGAVDAGSTSGDGIGGIAPSAHSMNPLVANAIQKYAGLPTEKLAELVSRLGPSAQGQIAQRVLQQKRMMPQSQAQAQQQQTPGQQPSPGMPPMPGQPSAQLLARGGATTRASGGDMGISPSQGTPWWTRREAGDASGFLHGTTPGRADSVLTTAPGGAYVLPADVVAGLGEGNSLAGARIADAIFSTGPHGIPQARQREGRGPPRPPAEFREQAKDGGQIKLFKGGPGGKQGTPVALSHGEYVISKEYCRWLGGGDEKAGHRLLDKWVVEQRKKTIKKTQKLPPPVKA
jgi:hypothetical protein